MGCGSNCGLEWGSSLPWVGACDGPCSQEHLLKVCPGTQAQHTFTDGLLGAGSSHQAAGVLKSLASWKSFLEAGEVTSFCPGRLLFPAFHQCSGESSVRLVITWFPPWMLLSFQAGGACPRAVFGPQDMRLASPGPGGGCLRCLPRRCCLVGLSPLFLLGNVPTRVDGTNSQRAPQAFIYEQAQTN